MIYLITGTPGTGKTSMALKWVLDNKFGLFEDDDGNKRPIYAVNIPNINKRVLPIADVEPADFVAKPLHENFPTGAVIFVDEALEIYPPRSASSKLPTHLEGLNKLRHYGLTLIVLTQSAAYLDPFLQALVGKHIHIERKQMKSRLYEWNHIVKSVNDTARKDAYSEIYTPDKRTFELYKSSSKHIKFKKSLSWYWYALPILPMVVAFGYWYASSTVADMAGVHDDKTPTPQVEQQSQPRASEQAASSLDKYMPATASYAAPSSPNNLTASDFLPTVAGRDESAPIYNSVRKVVDFPQIVGCVESAKGCNCYTQQASKVAMSINQCRDWLENRPFNAYKLPTVDKIPQVEAKSIDMSPSVYSLSGQDKLTLTKNDAYQTAQ